MITRLPRTAPVANAEDPKPVSKKAPLKFSVDARTILTLGRDSIKDHTTAVVELVKNSYDADATVLELEINSKSRLGRIRISDDGDGMSEREVVNNWLRIGYSAKRLAATSSKYSRRKTGEKGIGRLSADRLGAHLVLTSRAARSEPVGIELNWDSFDKAGVDLDEVAISRLDSPAPKLPSKAKTGTELIISKLRQTWAPDDVARLYQELELLTPPFSEIATKFQIRFTNDISPELNGVIEPQTTAGADVEIDARISAAGVLTYQLSYRDPITGKRRSQKGLRSWSAVAPTSTSSPFIGGPLRIKLAFFPKTAEVLEASGLNLRQLRSFLERNSGVRIYRDLIRVKPYGDPFGSEGDWLGLGERRLYHARWQLGTRR
jgi:hypothetical protein